MNNITNCAESHQLVLIVTSHPTYSLEYFAHNFIIKLPTNTLLIIIIIIHNYIHAVYNISFHQ